MKQLVLLKIDGAVAIVTLNRPERHNSLIPELLSQLLHTLNYIDGLNDVHAIILKANGRSFSTGGDVSGFYDHFENIKSYANAVVGGLNKVIIAMLKIKQPIIAAINGIVTGGSLGFILASDIVFITSKVSFTPYYSVVGFSPDGGWTAMLPMLIGYKRVAEILMCNSTITADDAVRWGIANEIVPEENIYYKAFSVAKKIALSHIGSIKHTKELLRKNYDIFIDRLKAEQNHFLRQIVTQDAMQGMKQFLRRGE